VHAACMMASDASSSPKRFHSRSLVDLDHTCGSIFEGRIVLALVTTYTTWDLKGWSQETDNTKLK